MSAKTIVVLLILLIRFSALGTLRVHDGLNHYYATGFMLNDLNLENDIIYVRNSRAQNPKIAEDYRNRNFYLYRYHRDTHKATLYKATLINNRFIYSPAILPGNE